MLPHEVETKIKGTTLIFYCEYIKEVDEDGYSPPKYFIMDGICDELAENELKKMGVEAIWKIECTMFNTTVKTVHILDTVQYRMTKREFHDCKRTLVSTELEMV